MDYPISSRAASLAPSLTLAISAKAKELRAQGEDVIGFGAGEPDFDTPQHIKDAAAQALADGFTKYTPSSGIPELRQAVANKFQRDYGVEYEPSQIIVNCGGKHSCFNAIYATCEAGDEVICGATREEVVFLVHELDVRFKIEQTAGIRINIDNVRVTDYIPTGTIFLFR